MVTGKPEGEGGGVFVRRLAPADIELFRAVPLLITIYVIWVALLTNRDALGLSGHEPQFWALVLGLTVYNGSVQAATRRRFGRWA